MIFPAGLLVGAAWILFNPNISMLDILPDCIAYALILYALRHISGFAPYMQEATDQFKKLFYITLFKLPALFIMLTMATQRVTVTLFSLSFAILELFFLIPAFNALFEGFYYLGSRFGCEAAIREAPKKPEAIQRMTILFLIVKHALSTLPDFLFLFEYDPISGTGFTPTNTQYFIVTALAFVVAQIFGFIWISYILPYLRAIAKDEGTKALTSPEGTDFSHREALRFRLGLPYVLFGAALCFSVDIIVDHKNLLPDYLAAACFLGLALVLYVSTERRTKLPILCSALYLVTTLSFSVFRSRFYQSFAESDLTAQKGQHATYLPANEEALAAYLPVNVTSVIAEILFVACVMLALHALYAFRKENKKTAPPRNVVEERFLAEEEANEQRHSIFCFTLACLSAVTSALYVFLLRFNARVEMQPGYGNTALYLPKSGAFWLLCLIISLALATDAVFLAYTRTKKLFKEHDVENKKSSSFD